VFQSRKCRVASAREPVALGKKSLRLGGTIDISVREKQFERTERIQDRAEKLQAKSADIVGIARKILLVIVPVVIALIVYVSWLIFRR